MERLVFLAITAAFLVVLCNAQEICQDGADLDDSQCVSSGSLSPRGSRNRIDLDVLCDTADFDECQLECIEDVIKVSQRESTTCNCICGEFHDNCTSVRSLVSGCLMGGGRGPGRGRGRTRTRDINNNLLALDDTANFDECQSACVDEIVSDRTRTRTRSPSRRERESCDCICRGLHPDSATDEVTQTGRGPGGRSHSDACSRIRTRDRTPLEDSNSCGECQIACRSGGGRRRMSTRQMREAEICECLCMEIHP